MSFKQCIFHLVVKFIGITCFLYFYYPFYVRESVVIFLLSYLIWLCLFFVFLIIFIKFGKFLASISINFLFFTHPPPFLFTLLASGTPVTCMLDYLMSHRSFNFCSSLFSILLCLVVFYFL